MQRLCGDASGFALFAHFCGHTLSHNLDRTALEFASRIKIAAANEAPRLMFNVRPRHFRRHTGANFFGDCHAPPPTRFSVMGFFDQVFEPGLAATLAPVQRYFSAKCVHADFFLGVVAEKERRSFAFAICGWLTLAQCGRRWQNLDGGDCGEPTQQPIEVAGAQRSPAFVIQSVAGINQPAGGLGEEFRNLFV